MSSVTNCNSQYGVQVDTSYINVVGQRQQQINPVGLTTSGDCRQQALAMEPGSGAATPIPPPPTTPGPPLPPTLTPIVIFCYLYNRMSSNIVLIVIVVGIALVSTLFMLSCLEHGCISRMLQNIDEDGDIVLFGNFFV
jgi:hypothetical protein